MNHQINTSIVEKILKVLSLREPGWPAKQDPGASKCGHES